MKKFILLTFAASSLLVARASWYWPFGSEEKEKPRVSELMAPATTLIDEASDLASEDKVAEAVEKYRAALVELDRIEAENPDRVETPEFATLKTKRAYIGAAIDSLLLNQARDNAKSVAVSDTTELERKLAEERGEKPTEQVKNVPVEEPKVKAAPRPKAKARAKSRSKTPRTFSKNEFIMKAIAEKDFATADRLITELLEAKPNSSVALNLRAAKESAEGKFKEAEATLDQAIQSNPRDYYAYYNMAQLFLQVNPENTAGARRYYETARVYGCPEDPELEALLK